jgi:hypothetical protein
MFVSAASLATPIRYPTNLMVYGACGYRFKDYFFARSALECVDNNHGRSSDPDILGLLKTRQILYATPVCRLISFPRRSMGTRSNKST